MALNYIELKKYLREKDKDLMDEQKRKILKARNSSEHYFKVN